MAISASTLFHFTNRAEHLISILTNEFRPRFCLEHRQDLNLPDCFPLNDIAIPMVCFCDLRLSRISAHLEFYGNYGIGLSKEWGIRNGLNPVMYMSKESYLNRYLLHVSSGAWDIKNNLVRVDIMEMLSFIKLIKGKMYREGRLLDRDFYDEREWRFVPQLANPDGAESKIDYRLLEKEFLDDVKRAHANEQLFAHSRIAFIPSDIRYIVVSRESEIISMIRAIRDIKEKYDPDDVDILTSRIISADQIRQDF